MPSTPEANTATVMSVFGAMGEHGANWEGLEAAISPFFADEVEWEQWPHFPNEAQEEGVPWVKRRSGKANCLEHFKDLPHNLQFSRLDVDGVVAANNKVLVYVVIEATHPATGKGVKDHMILDWTFNDDGKVTGFRHWLDTAKHIKTL